MQNSACTAHTSFYKSYTPQHTNTHSHCGVTVKGLRLKITANYFVCTVARLPGSPEVAVIDLSNPSFQHVILSPLPLSGATGTKLPHKKYPPQCQNLRVDRTVRLLHCHTAHDSSGVYPTCPLLPLHNNKYLMCLSWFKTVHSPYKFKGPRRFIKCDKNIFFVSLW